MPLTPVAVAPDVTARASRFARSWSSLQALALLGMLTCLAYALAICDTDTATILSDCRGGEPLT